MTAGTEATVQAETCPVDQLKEFFAPKILRDDLKIRKVEGRRRSAASDDDSFGIPKNGGEVIVDPIPDEEDVIEMARERHREKGNEKQSSYLLQPFLKPVAHHVEGSPNDNPILKALYGSGHNQSKGAWGGTDRPTSNNCHPFKKTELSRDLTNDATPIQVPKSLVKEKDSGVGKQRASYPTTPRSRQERSPVVRGPSSANALSLPSNNRIDGNIRSRSKTPVKTGITNNTNNNNNNNNSNNNNNNSNNPSNASANHPNAVRTPSVPINKISTSRLSWSKMQARGRDASVSSLRRIGCVNSERLMQLRTIVDTAIKNHKIYSMAGCYTSVRRALKQRGWIEKIDSDIKGKRKQNRFEDIGLYDAAFQFVQKYPTLAAMRFSIQTNSGFSHNDQINYSGQGEAEIINRMLRNINEDLCWLSRPFPYYCWKDLNKYELVNRLPKAYFSNKIGLCSSLQQIQWYFEPGVCSTQFPRTYNVSLKEEYEAFRDDFRITACMGLLKWLTSSYRTGGERAVRSVDGKIDSSIVDFALKRCSDYVKYKDHEDIDLPDSPTVWEYQWDNFILQYYKVINEGQILKENKGDPAIQILVTNSLAMLNLIKGYWPQIHIDGYQNYWVIKPGGRCCGNGIVIRNNLEQILMMVNPAVTRETRYIVQKYIERPLLIYNTKFDIRQWFLVTNAYPLTVWMYKDSYLRFSSQNFSLKSTHESIHLCNNAVQRKYKNAKRDRALPDENMWDCYTFQTYLKSRGYPDAWEKYIYPGMKEGFVGALLASQDTMERRKNCFELYGADFMISENMSDGPWLIEINSNPAMDPSTSVTGRLCPQVLEDIIKVVIDRRDDKNAPTGAWELVYKQQCPPVPPYLGISLSIKGQKVQRNGSGEAKLSPKKSKSHRSSSRKLLQSEDEDGGTEADPSVEEAPLTKACKALKRDLKKSIALELECKRIDGRESNDDLTTCKSLELIEELRREIMGSKVSLESLYKGIHRHGKEKTMDRCWKKEASVPVILEEVKPLDEEKNVMQQFSWDYVIEKQSSCEVQVMQQKDVLEIRYVADSGAEEAKKKECAKDLRTADKGKENIVEKEKVKEKEKEKEKEKVVEKEKVKEKEKEKEKVVEKEKEKVVEKDKEKAVEKDKEKAVEKEKEKVVEKEKEKVKEKAKEEKEKIIEKEKEKEKVQENKEKAMEKEKAKGEKEKIIEKEKEKVKEDKEKIVEKAKEKVKDKAKEEKEKVLEKEKVKEDKEKAMEKEKAKGEKEKIVEKEKVKEKAKQEKEKIKEDKEKAMEKEKAKGEKEKITEKEKVKEKAKEEKQKTLEKEKVKEDKEKAMVKEEKKVVENENEKVKVKKEKLKVTIKTKVKEKAKVTDKEKRVMIMEGEEEEVKKEVKEEGKVKKEVAITERKKEPKQEEKVMMMEVEEAEEEEEMKMLEKEKMEVEETETEEEDEEAEMRERELRKANSDIRGLLRILEVEEREDDYIAGLLQMLESKMESECEEEGKGAEELEEYFVQPFIQERDFDTFLSASCLPAYDNWVVESVRVEDDADSDNCGGCKSLEMIQEFESLSSLSRKLQDIELDKTLSAEAEDVNRMLQGHFGQTMTVIIEHEGIGSDEEEDEGLPSEEGPKLESYGDWTLGQELSLDTSTGEMRSCEATIEMRESFENLSSKGTHRDSMHSLCYVSSSELDDDGFGEPARTDKRRRIGQACSLQLMERPKDCFIERVAEPYLVERVEIIQCRPMNDWTTYLTAGQEIDLSSKPSSMSNTCQKYILKNEVSRPVSRSSSNSYAKMMDYQQQQQQQPNVQYRPQSRSSRLRRQSRQLWQPRGKWQMQQATTTQTRWLSSWEAKRPKQRANDTHWEKKKASQLSWQRQQQNKKSGVQGTQGQNYQKTALRQSLQRYPLRQVVQKNPLRKVSHQKHPVSPAETIKSPLRTPSSKANRESLRSPAKTRTRSPGKTRTRSPSKVSKASKTSRTSKTATKKGNRSPSRASTRKGTRPTSRTSAKKRNRSSSRASTRKGIRSPSQASPKTRNKPPSRPTTKKGKRSPSRTPVKKGSRASPKGSRSPPKGNRSPQKGSRTPPKPPVQKQTKSSSKTSLKKGSRSPSVTSVKKGIGSPPPSGTPINKDSRSPAKPPLKRRNVSPTKVPTRPQTRSKDSCIREQLLQAISQQNRAMQVMHVKQRPLQIPTERQAAKKIECLRKWRMSRSRMVGWNINSTKTRIPPQQAAVKVTSTDPSAATAPATTVETPVIEEPHPEDVKECPPYDYEKIYKEELLNMINEMGGEKFVQELIIDKEHFWRSYLKARGIYEWQKEEGVLEMGVEVFKREGNEWRREGSTEGSISELSDKISVTSSKDSSRTISKTGITVGSTAGLDASTTSSNSSSREGIATERNDEDERDEGDEGFLSEAAPPECEAPNLAMESEGETMSVETKSLETKEDTSSGTFVTAPSGEASGQFLSAVDNLLRPSCPSFQSRVNSIAMSDSLRHLHKGDSETTLIAFNRLTRLLKSPEQSPVPNSHDWKTTRRACIDLLMKMKELGEPHSKGGREQRD